MEAAAALRRRAARPISRRLARRAVDGGSAVALQGSGSGEELRGGVEGPPPAPGTAPGTTPELRGGVPLVPAPAGGTGSGGILAALERSGGSLLQAHAVDAAVADINDFVDELEVAAMHPNATVSGVTWAHYLSILHDQLDRDAGAGDGDGGADGSGTVTPRGSAGSSNDVGASGGVASPSRHGGRTALRSPLGPGGGAAAPALPGAALPLPPKLPRLSPPHAAGRRGGGHHRAHSHTVSGAIGREMAGALAMFSKPEARAVADMLALDDGAQLFPAFPHGDEPDGRAPTPEVPPAGAGGAPASVPVARSESLPSRLEAPSGAAGVVPVPVPLPASRAFDLLAFSRTSKDAIRERIAASTATTPPAAATTPPTAAAAAGAGGGDAALHAPQQPAPPVPATAAPPPMVPRAPPAGLPSRLAAERDGAAPDTPILTVHHSLLRSGLVVASGRSGSAVHLQASPLASTTPTPTGGDAAASAGNGTTPARGPGGTGAGGAGAGGATAGGGGGGGVGTPGVAAAMAALYPAAAGDEAAEEAALVRAERAARSRRGSRTLALGGLPLVTLPQPLATLSPDGMPVPSPSSCLPASTSWASTTGSPPPPPGAWYVSPDTPGGDAGPAARGDDAASGHNGSGSVAPELGDGLSAAARLAAAAGSGGSGGGGAPTPAGDCGGSATDAAATGVGAAADDRTGAGGEGAGSGVGEAGGEGDGLPQVWDVPGGTAVARPTLPPMPPLAAGTPAGTAAPPGVDAIADAMAAAYATEARAATVAAATAALSRPPGVAAGAPLDLVPTPGVWVSVAAATGGEVGLALAAVAAAAAASAGARPAAAAAAASLAMACAADGACSGGGAGGGDGGGGGVGGDGTRAAFSPAQVRSTLLSALANPVPNVPKLSLGIGTVNTMKAGGVSMLEYDGVLWKVSGAARALRRRRYYLQQNFLYWYSAHSEGEPRGVLYLEGSYVKPVADGAAEAKGYYGFSIHTSSSHGDRVRMLYAASAAERTEWIAALQRACRNSPVEDEYAVGDEIGRGKFAHVFRATRRADGRLFAIKIINKAGLTDAMREMLRTEIAIVKLVQHPHVVRVEAIYETGTSVYIVMEYMERGELFQNLIGRQRFSEAEARRLARQLVECLVYLHSMGIIHRDIKPENILCEGARPPSELSTAGGAGSSAPVFDVSRVKIGDFGLSKLVHPAEVMTQPCGSPQYVAPEVLGGGGYGKEADMWSIGIILHLVVRGRLPFDDPDPGVVYARTLEGVVTFDHAAWASWSPEGMSFIRGLLEKDRTRRFTARRAMQHPWLRAGAEVGAPLLPAPPGTAPAPAAAAALAPA